MVVSLEVTSVTSKGQVTIPKAVRQQLGIRQGSKLAFSLAGDHAEVRLVNLAAAIVTGSGFGLLKSKRKAAPADFDPASLLQRP